VTVIDPTMSLGAIVTAHPALARDLERLGLDYCCGGGRSLAEACAEKGLDPAAVTEVLLDDAATGGAEAWSAMGPAELVDHIEATHHAYLHDELPRLEALLAKVEGVHGERHPELAFVRASFDELADELDPHLAREERILFPMVRRLAAAGSGGGPDHAAIAGPIRVMLVEHDRAGELLERLRRLTDGYRTPDDGCASYRSLYEALGHLEADTHLHVHKENNVLFPAVLALAATDAEAGR
jgi:regulator of cell morphogenesis and NO signaling